MNLKSTSNSREFIPNISFFMDDEKGEEKLVYNTELIPSEQIVCEVRLASIEDKTFFAGNSMSHTFDGLSHVTNPKYTRSLTKYCKVIRNLSFDGKPITSGAQLIAHEPHQVLNDLILEIFPKIMGTYTDVADIKKKLGIGIGGEDAEFEEMVSSLEEVPEVDASAEDEELTAKEVIASK